MTRSSNTWYLRTAGPESGLWQMAAYMSEEFADGSVIDSTPGDGLPTAVSGNPILATHRVKRGLIGVTMAGAPVIGDPPLWFVSVDEPKANPAATNLVAYASDRFLPGTVISNMTFASVGASVDFQAGAVRWYPASGVIHQIFIAPEMRRIGLGTALIYAATAFHYASGNTATVRSDGRRTDIGEQFVAGLRHRDRITPRDAVMPPMDVN